MTTKREFLTEKITNFFNYLEENLQKACPDISELLEEYRKYSTDEFMIYVQLTNKRLNGNTNKFIQEILMMYNCEDTDIDYETKTKIYRYLELFKEMC